MQKRLLALVATVAMVLSMFAGVAFAAEPAITVTGQSFDGTDMKFTFKVTKAMENNKVVFTITAPKVAASVDTLGDEVAVTDVSDLVFTRDGVTNNFNATYTVPAESPVNTFAFILDATKFNYNVTVTAKLVDADDNVLAKLAAEDLQTLNLSASFDSAIPVDRDMVVTEATKVYFTSYFNKNASGTVKWGDVVSLKQDTNLVAAPALLSATGSATVTIPKGIKLEFDRGYASFNACFGETQDVSIPITAAAGEGYVELKNPACGFAWEKWEAADKDYTYVGLGPVPVESETINVAFFQDGLQVGTEAPVGANGLFVLKVAKAQFLPGALEIRTTDTNKLLAKGSIAIPDLTDDRVAVDRDQFAAGVPGQKTTFTITGLDELQLLDSEHQVRISFVDANGYSIGEAKLESLDEAQESIDVETTIAPGASLRDSIKATVAIQAKHPSTGSQKFYTVYSHSVSFKVNRVGNALVTAGLPVDGELEINKEYKGIPVVKYLYGGNYVDADRVVLTLNGGGIENKTFEYEGGAAPAVKPMPTEFGDVKVNLTAYATEGDKEKQVFAASYTWKVVGLKVEVSQSIIGLGKAADFVVTVTDGNGKPVNNATLLLTRGDAEKAIAKGTLNVIDGQYQIELKGSNSLLAAPGQMTITATTEDFDGTAYALVLGEDKYDVTLGATEFLRGLQHKPTIAIKEDATAVKASDCVYFYENEDGQVDVLAQKSGKVTIPADLEAGKYTIYVANKGKMGTVEFEVVNPVLVVDIEKLTDKVASSFTFKLVDPTNEDTALDWDIALVAPYAEVEVAEQDGRDMAVYADRIDVATTADNTYNVELVVVADKDAAAKADVVPYVGFLVKGDVEFEIDEVLEIGDAEFTVEPDAPVAGVNTNLTFKLVDANGEGLEGYQINRGSVKLGKTDENGEYKYAGRFIDVTTFTVALDAAEESVEAIVTPGVDDAAPALAEVPEQVDQAEFELVISDNVKVTKVFIDGEAVFFVPGAEVKIPLTLKLGENKFRITAADAADNYLDEVVTITYAPAGVKLTIGKTEYVANGETKTMEAAPYLKGDHTMIPVRALETFGVKYAWDQDTKTATFELDENVVKVTVGSTTAVVNGEQAAVPVAPEIVNNRTMAPLRFVLQNLGLKVHWVPGGEITITR